MSILNKIGVETIAQLLNIGAGLGSDTNRFVVSSNRVFAIRKNCSILEVTDGMDEDLYEFARNLNYLLCGLA